MANVCLPPAKAKEFREALKSKKITMESLINMTTEERTKILEEYAGKDAKKINTLFEEKIVLKNRMLGIKNWASKVGEIGRYSPTKKAEIQKLISEYRAKQQERIFSPQENETFLRDLAEEKLGTRITKEEAKAVFELSSAVEEKFTNFNQETNEWTSEKDGYEYGLTKYAYESLVSQIKDEDLSIKDSITSKVSEWRQQMKQDKFLGTTNLTKDITSGISDIMVSSAASWDASFMGRQGLKTLLVNPRIWKKSAKESFRAFSNVAKGQDASMMLMANLYSNPNYINGDYQKAKILAKSEEETPTNVLGKIPVVGKGYKASDIAFRNSAIMMRTQLYDFYSKMARTNGVEMTDEQIKDIGTMVNGLTARGDLGKIGEGGVVKMLLWAPRMMKSNWDTLTAHSFGTGLKTSFARKEAAKNSLKIIVELTLVLALAKALWPDSVEENPLSSDFGKIKIGDTRFDITAGMASLVTLAARILTQSSKSSTTGVVTKFGTGYGQRTSWDTILEFLTNKTAPGTRFIIDLAKREDYEGDKPLSAWSITKRFLPISIKNAIELKDNASADRVLGVIADVFGIAATSYNASEVDWGESTGKELLQFKAKVGQDKFQQANDKFNNEMSKWFKGLKNDVKYQKLTEEQKQDIITKKKDQVKQKVFKAYNFKYTPEKAEKVDYKLSK